jgi:hypothetical protein
MSGKGSNPALGRYPRYFRLAITSGIRQAVAGCLSRATTGHCCRRSLSRESQLTSQKLDQSIPAPFSF